MKKENTLTFLITFYISHENDIQTFLECFVNKSSKALINKTLIIFNLNN